MRALLAARRAMMLNRPSIFMVQAVMAFAWLHGHLPLPAFVAVLLICCLHPGVRPWRWASVQGARGIALSWTCDLQGISEIKPQQPTIFVIDEITSGMHLSKFTRITIAWSTLLLALDRAGCSLPLSVAIKMPFACTGPGARVYFQLLGFMDYRDDSVLKRVASGHHLLLFGRAHLPQIEKALPIVFVRVRI